jgi:hypothetical protein
VPIGALPAVVLRLELHAVATASRAEHLAVRPTPGDHVIAAILRVGEVDYRFLKGGGFGCHDYSVPEFHGIVKYICTIILVVFVSPKKRWFEEVRISVEPYGPSITVYAELT